MAEIQYDISCHLNFKEEIEKLMKLYDFRFTIKNISENKIIYKTNSYDTIEDFITNSIFYKNKRNLYYFPLENPDDKTVNLDISLMNIIENNKVLSRLLNHEKFSRYLKYCARFGIFFRFSDNKITRLYWNPTLNAGMPFSPKEKDPMYELVFFLHDVGHFLLTDLIFTGHKIDKYSKQIYVLWRLIGESFTLTINEMLCVDYLKDFEEYKSQQKLSYDKPYKLYQILKPHSFRELLYASCLFFCLNDKSGYDKLIDVTNPKHLEIYEDFLKRYDPVSKRGKEWTNMNFDNMVVMKDDYIKWYSKIQEFDEELEFRTIEEFYDYYTEEKNDIQILDHLFTYAFYKIDNIFNNYTKISKICDKYRKVKAFKRLIIGNLFLLIKHKCESVNYFVEEIKKLPMSSEGNMEHTDEIISLLIKKYEEEVKNLYDQKKITFNEYNIYKNIYIMIPPNIISKNHY